MRSTMRTRACTTTVGSDDLSGRADEAVCDELVAARVRTEVDLRGGGGADRTLMRTPSCYRPEPVHLQGAGPAA